MFWIIVGDLEEAVLLGLGVHPLDRRRDHAGHGRVAVATELGDIVGVQRQVGGEVLGEDVAGRLGVGALDLDLHVEAAGPQDRGVDHVLPVGGADHQHVLEQLHAVDLAEQLRDDGVLDIGGDSRPAGAEQ
jgi:hypothetical protein